MFKMKLKRGETGGFLLLSGAALALALLQSSCSTASSVAWSKIQDEGLIPYMVEHSSSAMAESQLHGRGSTLEFSESEIVPGSEGASEPGIVFTAQPVAGKPGFVFSPHTPTPLEVDVRGYRVGETVRCPYTERLFTVPSSGESDLDASVNRIAGVSSADLEPVVPRSSVPMHARIEAASESTLEPLLSDEVGIGEENLDVVEMAETLALDDGPIPGRIRRGSSDREPTVEELLAAPANVASGLPVGERVAGKPNYVYSPFAAANQVVDVEGYEPGTKVKCPYSGKIFEVPAIAEKASAE